MGHRFSGAMQVFAEAQGQPEFPVLDFLGFRDEEYSGTDPVIDLASRLISGGTFNEFRAGDEADTLCLFEIDPTPKDLRRHRRLHITSPAWGAL